MPEPLRVSKLMSPEQLLTEPVPPSREHFKSTAISASDCGMFLDMLGSVNLSTTLFDEALKCHRFHDVSKHFASTLAYNDSNRIKYIDPVLGLANQEFYAAKFAASAIEVEAIHDCLQVIKLERKALLGHTIEPDPTQTPSTIPVGMVFFVRPGGVIDQDWELGISLSQRAPSVIHQLLPQILHHCASNGTKYAMLSDEVATVILTLQNLNLDGAGEPEWAFSAWQKPGYSVREMLAWLIHTEATDSDCTIFHDVAHFNQVLGPLPNNSLLEAMVTANPQRLADFDRVTLERLEDPVYWDTFCYWRDEASVYAVNSPLQLGSVLRADLGSFLQENVTWRSPFPPHPLAAEDLAFLRRYPREADSAMTNMLSQSDGGFSFEVTDTVRVGYGQFSQVFYGIMSKEGRQSSSICLKLYDERFFSPPEWRPDLDPCRPLYAWNTAEDMARREEAAYDRLEYLQGSLLPHSYGFHYFTLPDGHRILGFLMERIPGPNMVDIGLSAWSFEQRVNFIKTIRTAFRAIRYAGIDQTDYNAGQFLFPSCSQEDIERGTLAVVCIDFAFAKQHSCLCHTPVGFDWQILWETLVCAGAAEYADEALHAYFEPRDEHEW